MTRLRPARCYPELITTRRGTTRKRPLNLPHRPLATEIESPTARTA